MVLIVACALAIQSGTQLVLARGCPLPDGTQYWGVEDTTLDSLAPDENTGTSFSLLGGPGKTILIRFGDLDSVIGPNKRIIDAKLRFSSSGDQPHLTSISAVKQPWSEGPAKPIASLEVLAAPPTTKTPTVAPTLPKWLTTYKARRTPSLQWQEPGANGNDDGTPIQNARSSGKDSEFEVDGLGPGTEQMRQRWYENWGYALKFSSPTEFDSSDSPVGKPQLILTLEDAPAKEGPDLAVTSITRATSGDTRTFVAHIKNVGTAPAKPFSAAWITGEKVGATIDVQQELKPGEETTLTNRRSGKLDDTDHRVQPLALKLNPGQQDVDPSNDMLEVQEAGFSLDVVVPQSFVVKHPNPELWVQTALRHFNTTYAPHSRFSFAPDGCLERIQLERLTVGAPPSQAVGDAQLVLSEGDTSEASFLKAVGRSLGLEDLSTSQVSSGATEGTQDRFPGLMGGGDTRYEGAVPGSIWLPYEPRASEIFDPLPTSAPGLLSATDVYLLNQNQGKRGSERTQTWPEPNVVMIKITDESGEPLANQVVSAYAVKGGSVTSDKPLFTVTANASGVAVLPKEGKAVMRGSDALMLVAESYGTKGVCWLKRWQLSDAVARGNRTLLMVEMPFNVSTTPLDLSNNLAVNKFITSSTGAGPADLAQAIDGKDDTEIALPDAKDSWVEIDLGRDRTIGEIEIKAKGGDFWKRFDLIAYPTGTPASQAPKWAQEVDWDYAAKNRMTPAGVLYRNASKTIRFIRLVNVSGTPGSHLAEIRVIAAQPPKGL